MISDLCSILETYLEPEQTREVYKAYLFAAEAHEGQFRKTGEPYIYHPVQVARFLAELRLDYPTIVAAILHDVIEDTGITKQQIAGVFDEEIAELVDGVSKLTHLKFETRAEAQAENFRKMLMAMARDIRVILIKLSDRIHNMRTLYGLSPEKRRRIAKETVEIYAPIASRLGINEVRILLENLGFKALCPMRYKVLEKAVQKARGNRKEVLQTVEASTKRRLREEQVEARIFSREKHLYGIYRKMRNKHMSFAEVMDVFALRIVVDQVDTCYRALGVIHNLYKPVPGRFKDYIAIPKANGYQSLHTVLFGPFGAPIEVQIRTEEMEKVAQVGVAAHWLYKSGGTATNSAQVRAHQWLQGLLEMQRSAGNSLEFLENFKSDLFPDEVYVFTPRGDILNLPQEATAVDFAYAVHTDVGNHCVGVKINRRLAPLRTKLLSGQTVEIITAPTARPNPAWLNFVVTGKARVNIRLYLKTRRHGESIKLGQRLLNEALANFSLTLDKIEPQHLYTLLTDLKLKDLDRLFEDIGLGNRMAFLIARRLAIPLEQTHVSDRPQPSKHSPLIIQGTEGMVIAFARCCHPIPGDPIVGLVSSGRGIVVHTENCNNLAEFRNQPERWIDVQWDTSMNRVFPVEIRVAVANRRGVLATVAAAIAETEANIENVGMEEHDGLTSTLSFCIGVKNRQHLARIMRRLRTNRNVMKISRPLRVQRLSRLEEGEHVT